MFVRRRTTPVIRSERELHAAQAAIARYLKVLADLRETASPEEFRLVAKASRPLIERLQRAVLDYLTHPDQSSPDW